MSALGPQLVEAEPADHDDEPATDVVDLADVGSHQASERLLHGVFGLAHVAEHAKADVEQVTSMVAPGPTEFDVDVAGFSSSVVAVHGLCSSWSRCRRGGLYRTHPATECDIAAV
jgi:hypothetical protein